MDAEWNIIYEKLDKCVKSGAKIVLSRLAIGDLATQYFADRDVFCAGRVMEEDLQRVAIATGASVQTTVNNVIPDVSKGISHFSSTLNLPFKSVISLFFFLYIFFFLFHTDIHVVQWLQITCCFAIPTFIKLLHHLLTNWFSGTNHLLTNF